MSTTRPHAKPHQTRHLLTVHHKFGLALVLALGWMALSMVLAEPWLRDLSQDIGAPAAMFVIGFVAIVPGFMNAFVFVALLLDRRPLIHRHHASPDITVLVAAYQEAASIQGMLHSLFAQDYAGRMRIIAINDGSHDQTAERVRSELAQHPELELIDLPRNVGKAAALNIGLARVQTELVVSLDADSHVKSDGIRHLVGRYLSDPSNTRAVAGEILIRNSRDNWITRAQEWDYFLGIASTKRVQSLFQGTLVAQGAFSLYHTETVRQLGGWPEMVGEDIVLTWKILDAGHRVGHAENAIVFTDCPNSLRGFIRQRQRWSRGLIEAFKMVPSILFRPRMSSLYIWWNLLFPFMDLAYTFAFLPGVILACFGIYSIAGPMTLALLPMAMLLNFQMYRNGQRLFRDEGLRIRVNPSGLITYGLAYGLILQPACVYGYLTELFNARKHWGTK